MSATQRLPTSIASDRTPTSTDEQSPSQPTPALKARLEPAIDRRARDVLDVEAPMSARTIPNVMDSSSPISPATGHVAAIVMAASNANTPLAVADAAGARLMFVNAAFAELLDSDAATWVGRPLSALGREAANLAQGATVRFVVALDGGHRRPVALSIAPVPGADGKPSCLLCSLVDARGDGADAAIALDAEMLAEVAKAAGDLMSAAAAAASASTTEGSWRSADDLALAAMSRTVHPADGRAS